MLSSPFGDAHAAGEHPTPTAPPAAERETPARRAYVRPQKRLASTATALVPGALVHGAGHFSVGEAHVGRKLLAAEGIGFGAFAGGLTGLALTGASRYTVAPFALLTIAGAGLFITSWLADVQGTATRPDERGKPPRIAAAFESELGHRYVYDPQFRYRHFIVQSLDARLGRLRLSPSAWSALDDQNARWRLGVAYRLRGPAPDRPARDGSFVDLEAAVGRHQFASDGFEARSAEVAISGRYDLARWEPALRGSFVEGGTGFALRETRYDIPGLAIDPDHESLLLARFGFGFYIGDPDTRGGETLLYYDHRHDDFAAGLKITGLGSGVAGHFGTLTRLWLEPQWGVAFDAQVGSAWVAGVSALFRWQGPQGSPAARLSAPPATRATHAAELEERSP